jgi:hypothetical protein
MQRADQPACNGGQSLDQATARNRSQILNSVDALEKSKLDKSASQDRKEGHVYVCVFRQFHDLSFSDPDQPPCQIPPD